MKNFEEKNLLEPTNSFHKAEILISVQQDLIAKTVSPNTENAPGSSSILKRQDSSTPPLPPKNVKPDAPPPPIRGITSIAPLPVPDQPAPPRPDSTLMESDKENNKNLEEATSDKKDDEAFRKYENNKLLRLKFATNNINEDKIFGTICGCIWWFLFILSRVLTVTIFFYFFPIYLLIIISAHYFLVLVYLFYYAKYRDFTTFFINLWLGLVYIFSIIEYRVKFKNADKILLFYYLFVTFQNICMTLVWYFKGQFDKVCYTYAFWTIIFCMSMCILSKTAYYLITLKLRKRSKIYFT